MEGSTVLSPLPSAISNAHSKQEASNGVSQAAGLLPNGYVANTQSAMLVTNSHSSPTITSPLQAEKYPTHMERPSVPTSATVDSQQQLTPLKPVTLCDAPVTFVEEVSTVPTGLSEGQLPTSTQQTQPPSSQTIQTTAVAQPSISCAKPVSQAVRAECLQAPFTLTSNAQIGTQVQLSQPSVVSGAFPLVLGPLQGMQSSSASSLPHPAMAMLPQPGHTITNMSHVSSSMPRASSTVAHPAKMRPILPQPWTAAPTCTSTIQSAANKIMAHPVNISTITQPVNTNTIMAKPGSSSSVIVHTPMVDATSTSTVMAHAPSTSKLMVHPASTSAVMVLPTSPSTMAAYPVHSLLPKVTCPVVIPTISVRQQEATCGANVVGMTTAHGVPVVTSRSYPFQSSSAPSVATKPGVSPSSQPLAPIYPSNVATNNPPLEIPKFQTGKVDAKQFPPRHYDFSLLEIGSWKHDPRKATALPILPTARFKAIFTQRKFIYEFQTNPNNIQNIVQGFREMACIEVPFVSVTGINISSSCEALIEVDSPPRMYQGKQSQNPRMSGGYLSTKYDYSNSVDLTGGQLSAIPYHKLKLSSINMKAKLIAFDLRFAALLATPIQVDPNKRLTASALAPVIETPKRRAAKENTTPSTGEKASAKKRRPSSSTTASVSPEEHVCHCSTGCSSKRCACFKTDGECSDKCKCHGCKNPLNALAKAGVSVRVAKRDVCLMDNICKIKDFADTIENGTVECPGCYNAIPLKLACTGTDTFECPDEDCYGEFKFSWCSWSLCEEETRPRYHCPICKRCGDYRDAHCTKCNKCYFAGTVGSLPCPCSERRGFNFIDSLGAFMMDLAGRYEDDDDSCEDEYGW